MWAPFLHRLNQSSFLVFMEWRVHWELNVVCPWMSLSQLLHALCFFLDIASYHNAPLLLYRLVFLNEFVFQCQTFRGILSYYCVVHFLPVFILNCVPLPYTVLFSLIRSIHLALTSEHNNQSDLITSQLWFFIHHHQVALWLHY